MKTYHKRTKNYSFAKSKKGIRMEHSKHISEFLIVAGEYCNLLENARDMELRDFFGESQKILSLLYFRTAIFGIDEPETEAESEHFVTEHDYTYIMDQLLKKFGDIEMYVDVYQPYINDSIDSEAISMAECYADIYQDIKNVLYNQQVGDSDALEISLWECLQNFRLYWGPRLLGLLNIIHALLYGESDLSEETGISENGGEKSEYDGKNQITKNKFSDFDNTESLST